MTRRRRKPLVRIAGGSGGAGNTIRNPDRARLKPSVRNAARSARPAWVNAKWGTPK